MRRREFIAGLGAAAWPRAAGAQQQALPVVGLLSSASPDRYSHYLQAFREGLGDTGHVEGRNVAIEAAAFLAAAGAGWILSLPPAGSRRARES
jgi:putative tryptophan/tyrosine transport system substrate-binding protein